jgi:carbonic anhydrase/acetyltransferase-like protein (isoleucine patch superfamily)
MCLNEFGKEHKLIRSLGNKIPKIHPTAFISEAAYVVGDVEIGEGSSIWPGTVIRGNLSKIVIGKYVNIQDNCVVHSEANSTTTIGNYVSMGHKVMCHATSVGDNCLLGNGSTVNSYTTIHSGSIVAAGTVVLERVEIPPNSLVVGIPGEVKRTISERHIELINKIWNDYKSYAQEFKEAGLEDSDRDKFNDLDV